MRNFICRKSVAVIKATKHLTNHTSDNGYTRKYLTKSVFAVASSKNFFYRRMSVLLGNSKLKCTRQNSTVCISLVLNNFIQKRLATKSRELNCYSLMYYRVICRLIGEAFHRCKQSKMKPLFIFFDCLIL